jgi:hypothetical protein
MAEPSQAGASITCPAEMGIAAAAGSIYAWIGGPYQTLAAMIR